MENNKTYLLEMTEDLHTKIKLAAVITGKSMKDFMLEALEKAVKDGN